MIGRRTDRPRRGMLAIAVLVCLIVLTMVAGALLRVGAAERDEVRAEERRLQAAWLAEAGLRRALAWLDAEPAYTGETWNIEARELGAAESATVAITIVRQPGDSKSRTIRVRADYPSEPPNRARCTRQITASLGGG